MTAISPCLLDADFRFVLLGGGGERLKVPFEKGWQETANYRFDDPKLLDHLIRGNNYGICGGYGDLHILDSDDLSRWHELGVLTLLPETFTVESRPGHRQFYLKCKEHFSSGGIYDPEKTEINGPGKPEYVHIGDLKAGAKDGVCGGQAVGPSSRHPSGSVYTVVQDLPIAEVSSEVLRSILSRFKTTKKVDTGYQKAEEEVRKAKQLKYAVKDPLDGLRVVDIMPPAGETSQSGDELRGDHPVHGSTNHGNFVINVKKNVWHCKRCESGGDVALAIAVKHGLISCAEAGPKKLDARLYKEVLKIAKREYLGGDGPGGDPGREKGGKEIHFAAPYKVRTGDDVGDGRRDGGKEDVLEISEAELDAYSMPEGPKFECRLPNNHFLRRHMAYGSEISDAYPDYWLASGLFSLAVVADKKLKLILKQGTIYPNLYISINGKSSLSRKSTVVDKTEAILCQVLPQLISSRVPTEFSPEAFTEHMSEHNHAPWIRDEAAGVLSLMKRDYMRGFKDSLMQLFDCKLFYRKLRTSQRKNVQTEFRVDDPYLNVLFATTEASLAANTDQNDTLSGFLARFLFFFPQGKKPTWLPLEEGTAQNSIFEGIVCSQLTGIAAKMGELSECAAMHFSPDAAAFYTEWQRIREDEWTASNDGFCMQIYSRLAPMVAKLGMLFELGSPDFEVSKPIRVELIQEACRLVDSYFMPTARAVYDLVGSNAEKNVIDRMTAYLKNHGGKATRKEILRDVKIKRADFNDYLDTMLESGIVETKIVKRGGKGRDSLWVVLASQPIVGNVANVTNVAKIANVEEIPSEKEESKDSTLATLVTMATSPIVATKPEPKTDLTGMSVEEIIAAGLKYGIEEYEKKCEHKEPISCAVCGLELVDANGKIVKGYLEKNSRFYCAHPGCGYPKREGTPA